jgi:protein-S-isoprenylcysteine O-methyltransferase Ste14
MTSSEDFGKRHHRIDRRRVAVYLVAIPAVLALFLFLPAGSVTWVGGWLFVLVLLPAMAVSALWLWRVNPEIYAARSRIHQGTKRWDRIVIAVMVPVMAAILPVAGLDAGRFRWSVVPRWVCLLGYALLLIGLGIAAWVEAVNRFFKLGVRIQSERGHKVIDSGPYAVVRHPGYVATSLLLVSVALALGSFWVLIPAGLATLLLLVRTQWEDRTLQDELVGYKDYTQRVRSRWVPGV